MKYLIFFVLLFSNCLFSQIQRSPEITVNELLEHVKYLSSEQLEGRKTGTNGAELAYKYISNEFKLYGLKPIGDDNTYYQKFDLVSNVTLGKNNEFEINISNTKHLKPLIKKDYIPLGFSFNGIVLGELIFAGYGISAPDKNYDDYKNIDIKGKIVLLLRYAPPSDSTTGFEQFSSLRYKTAKAKELGAKAIIFVTGPADSDKDNLMRLSYDQAMGNAGIPAINITRELADIILKESSLNIKQIQDKINSAKTANSFEIKNILITIKTDIREVHVEGVNVVGYLEGIDSLLRNEVIILGAHYDHLGMGGEGSGSLKPDTIAIHPGADDNASGTSALLELAQLFANQKDRLKRSILFIAFTGEEMGLLGSSYYVKHPIIPIENSVAMINMDMIGQLKDRKLIAYGVGTASVFDSLIREHNKDSIFTLKLNNDGYGPSDHSSFYSKKIPVLHFFTDINEYYHRPMDTYDKLNYDGLKQIANFVSNIAFDLSNITHKPAFIATESPKPMGNVSRNTRVYVGTIPDFGEQTDGMKISGVREGSPAAKAGLQSGDIIIKFGRVDVKNLYDYTYALSEYKAGDTVQVVIKREKELLTLSVILGKRN